MLRGQCNAGGITTDWSGVLMDTFEAWLVRQGIANLLSINCVERDGHRVTYDTFGDWLMYLKNGPIFKFKRDVGVCEGFPYLDMDNLKDHIVSPEECVSQAGLKEKVVAVRDSPKKKAFALVQTVRENMQGFTKAKKNYRKRYLQLNLRKGETWQF